MKEKSIIDGGRISLSLIKHVDFFIVESDKSGTEKIIILAVVTFECLCLYEFFEMLIDHCCDFFEADRIVNEKDLEQFL